MRHLAVVLASQPTTPRSLSALEDAKRDIANHQNSSAVANLLELEIASMPQSFVLALDGGSITSRRGPVLIQNCLVVLMHLRDQTATRANDERAE